MRASVELVKGNIFAIGAEQEREAKRFAKLETVPITRPFYYYTYLTNIPCSTVTNYWFNDSIITNDFPVITVTNCYYSAVTNYCSAPTH